MKKKIFAVALLAGLVVGSFATSVTADEWNQRGVIWVDVYTGEIDESDCVPAPSGYCFFAER